MKSAILASVLALGFAASANAAVVSVTSTVTLPVSGTTVVFGAPSGGGTTATQYWELINPTAFDMPTTITLLNVFPSNGTVVWDIYEDLNAAAGSANYGSLLASGTIGGANPTSAVYTFLASSNYVLKFSTQAIGAINSISSVPVPAAAWLFGSALFGAGALRRKQQA